MRLLSNQHSLNQKMLENIIARQLRPISTLHNPSEGARKLHRCISQRAWESFSHIDACSFHLYTPLETVSRGCLVAVCAHMPGLPSLARDPAASPSPTVHQRYSTSRRLRPLNHKTRKRCSGFAQGLAYQPARLLHAGSRTAG